MLGFGGVLPWIQAKKTHSQILGVRGGGPNLVVNCIRRVKGVPKVATKLGRALQGLGPPPQAVTLGGSKPKGITNVNQEIAKCKCNFRLIVSRNKFKSVSVIFGSRIPGAF